MEVMRGGHYLTPDESVDPELAFLILFSRGATMDRFDHTIGIRLVLCDDKLDRRTWQTLKLLEDQMVIQKFTTKPKSSV